jgi:ABC-2 type transport system permease protein
MKRIRWMIYKELIQIRRDPRLFGILLIAPVIQLVILGFAATTDVKEVNVAVRDYDRTSQSREYVRALSSSGYLKTMPLTGPPGDDDDQLVSGKAGLILTIPAGFGQNLVSRQPASVQVLVDGSDSNFAVQGLSYLQRATRLHTEGLIKIVQSDLIRLRGLKLPAITAQTRIWYNPDLKSSNYMLPAIMGMLLLVATMIVTSMALVKEREQGTMEQLIITPISPMQIIAGKLLPFVLIGFGEVTLVLAAVVFVFGVPLRGSLLLLYLLSGLFLFSTLGMGLLVSTLVRTQQQAMMVAGFGVMLPFALLSGFIFPIENMPDVIQPLTYLIPFRYFLTIVRGIFLKGTGLHELWQTALALLTCGIVILSLAVLRFHKRMD